MPLPALFLKPYLRIWKIVVPLPTQKAFYLQGEMAEWSIAAGLKTVEGHTSGGSNPSLSAIAAYKLLFFLCEETSTSLLIRRDARVVEEARLESVYTPKAYRGFESRFLR